MFRVFDILTVQWAAGDLPEDCRFFLGTQLMFLKKEPTKRFDDDEWIWSLTEPEAIATDTPDGQVACAA